LGNRLQSKRQPRWNQETKRRQTFLTLPWWGSGGAWPLLSRGVGWGRAACRPTLTPLQRECPEEPPAIPAVRRWELDILPLQTPALAVGQGRFDRPPRPVIYYRRLGRLTLHRHDPWLFITPVLPPSPGRRHLADNQPDVGPVACFDSLVQVPMAAWLEAVATVSLPVTTPGLVPAPPVDRQSP
jgi:hypothetical protein